MMSLDKLLSAAAVMSVELGPEASADLMTEFKRVEDSASALGRAMVAAWKKSLNDGKPLSPATSKLVQKVLKG